MANEEGDGGNTGSTYNGVLEHLDDAVVLASAVVVANDRLHTLVEAHGNHNEEQQHSIHDAVGTHIGVANIAIEGGTLDNIVLTQAAIGQQHRIHKACYERGAEVEQEGGHADRDDMADDAYIETEVLPLEAQEATLGRIVVHLYHEGHKLSTHSSQGRACDAPLKDKDKEWVECRT